MRRPTSKSTKINALRSLYHEMFPERPIEEIGSQSSSEKVVVGHVDTAQASNEPIVVYAEAEPAAPEVTDDVVHVDEDTPAHDEEDTESEHTQGEDAVPQMTHEEADLVAIDLIEVDESDIDPIIADVVPGAAHVCGAPVPDALAAAEMAPMLDHARQRKKGEESGTKKQGQGQDKHTSKDRGNKENQGTSNDCSRDSSLSAPLPFEREAAGTSRTSRDRTSSDLSTSGKDLNCLSECCSCTDLFQHSPLYPAGT